MFWKSKSKNEAAHPPLSPSLDGLNAEILLITQSAKVLFTSETLDSRGKEWLGGAVMEIMISSPAWAPFFIYYENNDYYGAMVTGRVGLSDAQRFERYRAEVSTAACQFLVSYMHRTYGIDIRHPQAQFTHNRIHTNVIAFVESLQHWYPIHHGASEDDSASERKVAMVNSGKLNIAAVIATDGPSPH